MGEDASRLFFTTITEGFTEIAHEYENRQSDHVYTQEQVREKLTGKNISEEENLRAKFIWKLFKCKKLLYYTKLIPKKLH